MTQDTRALADTVAPATVGRTATAAAAASTHAAPAAASTTAPRTSAMAEALVGSEILKIAAEIRALRAAGTAVCNLTVGDFDPGEFRIPELLERGIEEALRR